jgi:hypothetical protein
MPADMYQNQKEEIFIGSVENINFIYVITFQDKFEIAVKSPIMGHAPMLC